MLRLILCTNSFNIQKFSVLPTLHLCVLRGSQKKTAIISLYTIYLSVFITEAESVYCAVRTGSLNQTGTVSSFRVTYIKICAEKVFVDIMKFVCSCEELVHKMRGL